MNEVNWVIETVSRSMFVITHQSDVRSQNAIGFDDLASAGQEFEQLAKRHVLVGAGVKRYLGSESFCHFVSKEIARYGCFRLIDQSYDFVAVNTHGFLLTKEHLKRKGRA